MNEFLKIFLEKWVPAIITGGFLVGLVPLINYFYWKKRREIEEEKIKLEKQIEVWTSTSRLFASCFQHINRIREIKEKIDKTKGGEEKKRLSEMVEELDTKRIDIEPELSSHLKSVAVYFCEEPAKKSEEYRDYYNKLTMKADGRPLNADMGSELVQKAFSLLDSMGEEIKGKLLERGK